MSKVQKDLETEYKSTTIAVSHGEMEMLEHRLKQNTFKVSYDNNYFLNAVIIHGRTDLVKIILTHSRFRAIEKGMFFIQIAVERFGGEKKIERTYISQLGPPIGFGGLSDIVNRKAYPGGKKPTPPTQYEQISLEIFYLLLEDKRLNISYNNLALREACEYNIVHVVRKLLKDIRIDPSIYDNEAFIIAVNNDNIDIVKLLILDRRVNPAARNNKAILIASRLANTKMIKFLYQDKRVIKGPRLDEVSLNLKETPNDGIAYMFHVAIRVFDNRECTYCGKLNKHNFKSKCAGHQRKYYYCDDNCRKLDLAGHLRWCSRCK